MWDSITVVMIAAAIDDLGVAPVDGEKLADCQTVDEILRLAKVAA